LQFFRIKSLLPYITRRLAGREVKLLIDTGTSKNYIAPLPMLKGVVEVETPFSVKSIHGHTQITKKCLISIFQVKSHFFLLNALKGFDGIIGLDLLKQVNAKLDFTKNMLQAGNATEKLQFTKSENVNFIKIDDESVPHAIKSVFDEMIKKIIEPSLTQTKLYLSTKHHSHNKNRWGTGVL